MLGPEVTFVDRDYMLVDGKRLLYLGGTDYHRLSRHPLTISAVVGAVRELGIGPTGSRVTSGNHLVYAQLEEKIASFFESESAVVFPTGYLSNTILLQRISGDFNLYLIDDKAHPSIVDAANMVSGQTGAKVVCFEHVNSQHLEDQLKKHLVKGGKPLVMTDGVFPLDGNIPPLSDYATVLEPYGGKMLIDDAHAVAVLGETGKGSWEETGIAREMVYQTGTLSKGFGAYGGMIAGPRSLIEGIYDKSTAFIGCTGLALPLAAAGIFTVSYLTTNREKINYLQQNTIALKQKFRSIGFEMPETVVPVFGITFGDTTKNQRLKKMLIENEIYPSFINYPGGSVGGQFRFIITSSTTDEQMSLLFDTIKYSTEVID
jgi:7-keto-8-aminopelargonate synthetase-like enzyme